MEERVITAAIVVIGVPAILVGYISLAEGGLGLAAARLQAGLRPWLWLLPALALLLILWVYPTINTIIISFFNADSTQFIGLANFAYVFTDGTMLAALKNNILWLVFFTFITVTLGLVIAVLTDRVPYEAIAKAVIFLPMAISATSAAVIWRFMLDYRPPGAPQTGTLNALLGAIIPGFKPQAWLVNQPVNDAVLIIAYAWVWTGFCMVILSAALKGIPTEILEAARVDGANELQVFFRIIVPMLGSTIAVVTTMMVVTVVKLFDWIYVTTNGNYDTEVIANRMYKELFNFRDFGRAGAIAVLLLLAVIPVVYYNLRQFRTQGAR